MKNFGKISAVLILMMTMVACHFDKGIQTEYCRQDKSLAFEEGSEEQLHVKFEVEYVNDGMKAEVREAVNQVIVGAAFGNKYAGLSVPEAADMYVQDVYKNYKESNASYLEDMKESEMEEMSRASFNWENRLDAAFLNPYEHYLIYMVESYSFEGGAHGMSWKIPVVMDSKTGKVIEEEDFFVAGYKEELSRLLSGNLHDSFEEEEDYECLFTKDIEPNGNFYLTSKGVVYVYGAYDIGPYYLGIIEVTVPWEELEGLLK